MSRVQSIRLGGKAARKAGTANLKSLDTGGREGAPLPEDDLRVPVPDHIDTASPLAAIGLDHDDEKYLLAKIEGVKRREMPVFLRWTRARVDATRMRVSRRLKRVAALNIQPGDFVIRGDSRHLAFKTAVAGGYVWELAEVTSSFADIMNAERADLFCKNRRTKKSISRAA